MKYINQLYESIINDIAKIVKYELNEMSKNISFRNIDRKLWLSVASICSKNKSTEAEFIKPMKKLTKEDLLQRYVAALLIMKKPCPKNKKEIETLKTFKLFAQKALDLGASITDIKELYNQNNNVVTTKKQIEEKPIKTTQQITKTPVQRKTKVNKYTEILDNFIINLPDRLRNNLPISLYKLEDTPSYKACQLQLETYINGLIKKSHNSFEKFLELIQKDYQQFYKIINFEPKYYVDIKKYVGGTHSTFNSFNHYLNIKVNNEKAEIYETYENNSLYSKKVYRNEYNDKNIFKTFTKYVPNIYVNDNKTTINLLQEFCKELFYNIVKPYINIKKEQEYENNKLNSSSSLKKYKMQNKPNNLQNWAQTNLQNILHNNPNIYINVDYSDWNGGIKSIYYDYSKNKYFMNVWCENRNSDHDDTDYLNNLLNSRDTYRFDANYNNYTTVIHNLDDVFEKIYDNIYEQIIKGIIK